MEKDLEKQLTKVKIKLDRDVVPVFPYPSKEYNYEFELIIDDRKIDSHKVRSLTPSLQEQPSYMVELYRRIGSEFAQQIKDQAGDNISLSYGLKSGWYFDPEVFVPFWESLQKGLDERSVDYILTKR